jgi:hypothetical protein
MRILRLALTIFVYLLPLPESGFYYHNITLSTLTRFRSFNRILYLFYILTVYNGLVKYLECAHYRYGSWRRYIVEGRKWHGLVHVSMGTTRYRVYQVVESNSSKILLGPIVGATGPRRTW